MKKRRYFGVPYGKSENYGLFGKSLTHTREHTREHPRTGTPTHVYASAKGVIALYCYLSIYYVYISMA